MRWLAPVHAHAAMFRRATAQEPVPGEKRKLTKREKEAAEREMRRNMPPRSQCSRNGVFEFTGTLAHTWAVGQIPGGPFKDSAIVLKGHTMYLFGAGQEGHKPTAKPDKFFNIRRAEVHEIPLLHNPPLPPHMNVLKLVFNSKQFQHRGFFFKAPSNAELQRWLADLRWRTQASESEVRRRFEPDYDKRIAQLRIDETESAVLRQPERVLGMVLRYPVKALEEAVDMEEEATVVKKKKDDKKGKPKAQPAAKKK